MLSVVRRRSTVFTPSRDAAHFQMGDGRALAGMDILRRQDEIELAFLLDDIAFAHRAGDNRNHGKPRHEMAESHRRGS